MHFFYGTVALPVLVGMHMGAGVGTALQSWKRQHDDWEHLHTYGSNSDCSYSYSYSAVILASRQ